MLHIKTILLLYLNCTCTMPNKLYSIKVKKKSIFNTHSIKYRTKLCGGRFLKKNFLVLVVLEYRNLFFLVFQCKHNFHIFLCSKYHYVVPKIKTFNFSIKIFWNIYKIFPKVKKTVTPNFTLNQLISCHIF